MFFVNHLVLVFDMLLLSYERKEKRSKVHLFEESFLRMCFVNHLFLVFDMYLICYPRMREKEKRSKVKHRIWFGKCL